MVEEQLSPSEDEVIRLAFELEEKPATEVLLQLGKLDLWRGDLSVMRGDVPASESEPALPPMDDAEARTEALYSSIFMKNALRYLTTKCREILRSRYAEHHDIETIARHLETTPRYADKLIFNCRERAYTMLENMRPLSLSPELKPHKADEAHEPDESREPDIRQLPGETRRAR
jgi:hypothetical protein